MKTNKKEVKIYKKEVKINKKEVNINKKEMKINKKEVKINKKEVKINNMRVEFFKYLPYYKYLVHCSSLWPRTALDTFTITKKFKEGDGI